MDLALRPRVLSLQGELLSFRGLYVSLARETLDRQIQLILLFYSNFTPCWRSVLSPSCEPDQAIRVCREPRESQCRDVVLLAPRSRRAARPDGRPVAKSLPQETVETIDTSPWPDHDCYVDLHKPAGLGPCAESSISSRADNWILCYAD